MWLLSWLGGAASVAKDLPESDMVKQFLSESANFNALKKLSADSRAENEQIKLVNDVEQKSSFSELLQTLSSWDVNYNPITQYGINVLLCKDSKLNHTNGFQYFVAQLIHETQLKAPVYQIRNRI